MNKEFRKTTRFTNDELSTINKKMLDLNMTSFSQYIRKMAIYGFVVVRDNKELKELLNEYSVLHKELNAIGTNVNQIAKRLNSTQPIYNEDIQEIKNHLENISSKAEKSLNEIVKKYQES